VTRFSTASVEPGRPITVAADGHFRRMFLLAAHPGEGRFTSPTAAIQAWRPELVFMPLKRPSHCEDQAAVLNRKRPFAAG